MGRDLQEIIDKVRPPFSARRLGNILVIQSDVIEIRFGRRVVVSAQFEPKDLQIFLSHLIQANALWSSYLLRSPSPTEEKKQVSKSAKRKER